MRATVFGVSILACFALHDGAHAQGGFAGTYELRGRAAAEQGRNAGVEAAIQQMGIGKNIARRRLLATTPIPPRIIVEERGERLHVRIVGAYELTSRPDGSPSELEDAFGYDHTARLYERANTLVLTLRDQADCRIELRFSADRSRLTYVMRIRSDQLPGDVRYQATYHRR